VAVWLVTAHWKLPQLEKSGSVESDAVTEDAVVRPCTTQVPSSDGVVDVPAAVVAEVVLVGPSTLVVRSTLQAEVAASTASTELKGASVRFIRTIVLVSLISADIPAADTVSYRIVVGPTILQAPIRHLWDLLCKQGRRKAGLHEACQLG
jgi:hypothetical protein